MILITDKTVTRRAEALRERLFSLGCPCAVCASCDIRRYLPAGLMITFTDHFDELRRYPYDSIHTVAIGDGFVNSALNAQRAPDADTAIYSAHSYLMAKMGITEDRILPFGVVPAPGLFVSDGFIEIYGNMIRLTRTEIMIFKYLTGLSSQASPVPPEKIEMYTSLTESSDPRTKISMHISSVNRKVRPFLKGCC